MWIAFLSGLAVGAALGAFLVAGIIIMAVTLNETDEEYNNQK